MKKIIRLILIVAFFSLLGYWGTVVYKDLKYKRYYFYVETPSLSLELETTETISLYNSLGEDYNSDYVWSSSDESIATVDSNGVVTGVGSGSCEIIIKSKKMGKKKR